MLQSASRGSHRKAFHHDASLFPCQSTKKYQVKKLASLLSWIGFLASAVSEYGFDVDFPLTPTFWLAIAFCVMFASIGHAAVGHRIHGVGKREIGTNLSGDAPSLSHFAGSQCVGNKSLRTSDRSPNLYQPDLTITGGYLGQMSAGGVLVTPSDAAPAVTFLCPVATRGPPSASEKSTYPFDGAPLSPQIRLHDSPVSVVRSAFHSGTDQTPIRSAIDGEPT
jgi:hypothetical protein